MIQHSRILLYADETLSYLGKQEIWKTHICCKYFLVNNLYDIEDIDLKKETLDILELHFEC